MKHLLDWQKVKAYFRLIRWKNLLMVLVTMILSREALIRPLLGQTGMESDLYGFFILVISALLVTAGGYIINDYFDVKIDRVNKPERVIVGRELSFSTVLTAHQLLSGAGILLGFYAAYLAGSVRLGGLHLVGAAFLWFYAFKYKRMLLWGNLVVAMLSSMIVPLVWLFAFFSLRQDPLAFTNALSGFPLVNRFVAGFFLFSLLLSLAREIAKDITDREGDRQQGCQTLPIRLGPDTSMLIVRLLVLTSLLLLLALSFFFLLDFSRPVFFYTVLLLVPAHGWLIWQAGRKEPARQAREIEQGLKGVMGLGILSMLLISL